MATLLEIQKIIGQTADYNIGNGVTVWVIVRDARVRYGDLDYLIEPVAGKGTKWVASYKLVNYREGDN
jgi:hypothetical protein